MPPSADLIAIAGDGVSFPYRRLLTDASTGVMAEAVIACYGWQALNLNAQYTAMDFPGRVAMLVTLAVLSLPLGVAVSTISFVVFSSIVFYIEWALVCLIHSWFFRYALLFPIHRMTDCVASLKRYEISLKDYPAASARITVAAEVLVPEIGARFHHFEAVCILCRNLSTICIAAAFLPQLTHLHFTVLLCAAAIFLLSAGYICAVGRLDTLFRMSLMTPFAADYAAQINAHELALVAMHNTILRNLVNAKATP